VTSIIERLAAELRRLRSQARARRGADHFNAHALDELARRVDHLEAQFEGLQDAVYRQDVVHDRRISDLRTERTATSEARSSSPRGERT
jgi:ribosomal protein S2